MTVKLYNDDAYQKDFEAKVIAVTETEHGPAIQLSQTLFYPMGGGQPGDIGSLTFEASNDSAHIPVVTTRKGEGLDDVLHFLEPGTPLPPVGSAVKGTIDWETRHKLMRMHSCMHLVCAIIEGDVTGGQVGIEKSRLDFNIETSGLDKEELTNKLNSLIEADHPVGARWISEEELEANPQLVRTMSVKPPMGSGKVRLLQIGTDDNIIDLQPCGGTHVQSTKEIGQMRISKIENKGKQNKRINIIFDDAS